MGEDSWKKIMESPFYRIRISAFAIFLIVGQIWAISAAIEDWPLGANAMFAYDVDQLFEVIFHIETAEGKWRRIEARRDLGLSDAALKRKFFAKYYGSNNPNFAQRYISSTPQSSRVDRLRLFSLKLHKILVRQGQNVHSIRIDLDRLGSDYKTISRHTLFQIVGKNLH
jgi:hypothetical protein